MMLIMMAKESSNLIGLENFGAVGFSITAGLGWYSPYQSISDQISTHQIPPHPPPPTKFLHSPHENLMAMKVCCRQKNFSPPLKFWKFLLAIDCFCWSLPICKNSNLLFWITLDTTDHIHLKWLSKCVTSIASLPHAKN